MISILSSDDRMFPSMWMSASYVYAITSSYTLPNTKTNPMQYVPHTKKTWNDTPVMTKPRQENIQEQLEKQTFELLDANEKLGTLTMQNVELQSKLDSLYAAREKYLKAEGEFRAAEYTIVNLNKELATQTQNRDHFRTLVAQQDAFIKEMKTKIEEYRATKIKETEAIIAKLKQKTEEAEHLAKQAIRLTDENSNLRAGLAQFQEMQTEFGKIKTDVADLTVENENHKNGILAHAESEAKLLAENTQLKEQNNRYLEENRKFHDQINDLTAECERVDLALKKARTQNGVYQAMTTYQTAAIQMAHPFLQKLATRLLAQQPIKDAFSYFEDNLKKANDEASKLIELFNSPKP